MNSVFRDLPNLAERIQNVFGSDFEWVKCSEMARRYAEILNDYPFVKVYNPVITKSGTYKNPGYSHGSQ